MCGRPTCPILKRIVESIKASDRLAKSVLETATPPSVLVGEWGYPRVRLGPIAAPVGGEKAKMYEDYRRWWGKLSLEEIIALRASTVYSRFDARVREARGGNRLLEATREAALSVKPVDAEFIFAKPPRPRLAFDGILAPVGLGGKLRQLRLVENPSVPRKADQLVEDTDAKVRDAVRELYRAGADSYYISRLLSLGMLGERNRRRLVPTRWAITATDKVLGDMFLSAVRHFPEYWGVEVYRSEYIGNRYVIALVPGPWSFEMIEIWLPRSVWVRTAKPYVACNYELWDGKPRRPGVDGGYYAIRLPVLEHLYKIGRQATVIAVREITPKYYAPVGSWQIRESVRAAFSKPPLRLEEPRDVFAVLSKVLETSVDVLLRESYLLKRLLKPDFHLDRFLE